MGVLQERTIMTRYCVTIPANQGINGGNQPVEFWCSSEAAATSLTTMFLKQNVQATLRQSILQPIDVKVAA